MSMSFMSAAVRLNDGATHSPCRSSKSLPPVSPNLAISAQTFGRMQQTLCPPETKILVARATAYVVCCARVRVRRVFRGSACAASAFGDLCHDKRWPWGGKRRRLVLAASQRVLHATRSLGSQRNHYRSGELNCSRQESVALPTLHPEDVHKAQDGSWKAANLLRNDIQEASPAGARLNQPLLRG
jgi:hypothetical protein